MSEDKQIINISFDFNDISEIKDKDDFNNQENRFLGLNYSFISFFTEMIFIFVQFVMKLLLLNLKIIILKK